MQKGIPAGNPPILRHVRRDKKGKFSRHTRLVEFLIDFLRSHLGAEYCIRQEQPLTLPDSEPEPDIAKG